MISLKDFFEHDMFDILAGFHAVRFVIRSGLSMKCHGAYDDIMKWTCPSSCLLNSEAK